MIISGQMIKKILIAVIILSSFVFTYLAYDYLKSASELAKDPIVAVPLDAAIIIESHNLQQSWLRISETNLVYASALNIPEIDQLNGALRMADSLLSADPVTHDLFDNKSTVVSIHNGNGMQFFMATTASDQVFEELKVLFSKTGKHVKSFNDEADMEQYEIDGQTYFVGYYSPFVMFSSEGALIHKSVIVREENKSLLHEEYLQKLRNSASSNLGVSIYVNGPKLGTLLTPYITKDFAEAWQQKKVLPDWLLLDINEKSNTIIFNGLSSNQAKNKWFDNILHQEAKNTKSLNLLPTDLLSLQRFSIADPAQFVEDFDGVGLDEMQSSCDCNPNEVFANWINGELISITFGNDKSRDNAYLVGCEGVTNIIGVLSSFGVADTIYKTVYNAELYAVKDKKFLQILGISDTTSEPLYFTRMNDYAVVSTFNGLSKIAYQYKASQASIPNNRFINFAQKLMANYSSSDAYFSWDEALYELQGVVKKEYHSKLTEIEKLMPEINGLIWQGSRTKDDEVYHSIAVNTNQANEQKGAVQNLWSFSLQHDVTYPPQIIKNHQTGTNEVLVQDNSNTITLISATGKHKWSKDLGEPIIGQVKQVDIYQNGKYQMVFNTANKIHLLDINGNEVEGFPIKLLAQATNEVAVFDYDKNGNYRFLINTIDKQFRNYSKEGKAVEGWMAGSTQNIVINAAERFVLDGLDYIAITDLGGKVYLYSRKGEIRPSTPEMITTNFKNQIYLQVGTTPNTTRFIYRDSLDGFVELSINGETKSYYLDSTLHSYFHAITDLENDKLPDYVIAFGNKLSVYGPDKELRFSELFDFDLKENFKVLGENSKFTLVADDHTGKAYLYNYQFKPVQDFPQQGSIHSNLGDLNNDGKIEFITIVNGKEVVCYTVDLLFGI